MHRVLFVHAFCTAVALCLCLSFTCSARSLFVRSRSLFPPLSQFSSVIRRFLSRNRKKLRHPVKKSLKSLAFRLVRRTFASAFGVRPR